MAKKTESLTPVARQLSIRAVVDAFLERGSITRAQLAEITGLSKQTMSEVVRDLVAQGWLKEEGQVTGSVGRRAVLYEFQESACYVLGVDLGGSNLRAAIASLNGKFIVESIEETDLRGGIHVIDQIAALVERMVESSGIDRSAVYVGVIAVSGVFQKATGAVVAAPNIAGISNIDFSGRLSKKLDLTLLVENTTDMATRGEHWRGHAQGVDNFVYLNHGAGIGMGAMIDGRLLKGRRGAIGEISTLPFGPNPFDSRHFEVGTFETEVGANAIVRKYECYGGASGKSVREIFHELSDGSEIAEMVIDETARLVALAIVAASAILDPEMVIMGGQIGVHPAMMSRVASYLKRSTPLDLTIKETALGARASLAGALQLGANFAYDRIFSLSASASLGKNT